MPKIDFIKSGSGEFYGTFLSAKNTNDLTPATIVNGGREDMNQPPGADAPKPRLLLPLKLPDGKTYTYSATRGKLNVLIEAWGDDSDAWAGKEVMLRKAYTAFGDSILALPKDHDMASPDVKPPVMFQFMPQNK